MDLTHTIESIYSRDDLIEFVIKLRTDLTNHPETWENVNLDSYLDAMAAWLRDSDGYYTNHQLSIPSHPTWKVVAEILLAAKYYE